ncbi:MAG: type II toxin-antitoxin system HigB family toxin [Candidatus Hatepunaea meridiana]|nr:type II toxin-antitoxin system HigB family toxin [Candidatus Hatepunaea meridiana]
MRVISKSTLKEFWEKHSDSKSALEGWYYEVRDADWETSQDIKNRYSSASFLPGSIVVFNIKGRKYRLVVKVDYKFGIVFIRMIGTHKEYSKWKLK